MSNGRKDQDISYAFERAIGNFARFDILFNHADICAYGLSHKLPEEE